MADTIYYTGNLSSDAVLVVFNRNGILGSYSLGLCTSIGRAAGKNQCDIPLHSSIVSRRHGEIGFADGKYFYRDLDSTNGTYHNKKLIGRASPDNIKAVQLSDGDILGFDIIKNGEHYPECVFALFSNVIKADTCWNQMALDSNIAEICIGRSSQSELKIENNMISEKHASFFCSKNGWAIIDHHSTNGVFLNGKKITSPRYLNDMDVIRIADVYFIFLGDKLLFSDGIVNKDELLERNINNAPAAISNPEIQQRKPETKPVVHNYGASQLKINIVERSVIQRFKKMTLLQDINISITSGQMVLILGGSGAGKTTFIHAVTGYEKAVGKILYNDTDIYEEYEQMKYEIGFVPQQDLLRGSDTVYSTLSNAAEMKLPKRFSYEKREERVGEVLEEFGLTSEKNKLVSKLSGGQKKRLSIAVEFIADPSLFFLDEPDSGLDNAIGRGLMENLRHIADKGKIVMVITHSPERAIDLFDKVIVLAKSMKDNCGHTAFFGSVDEAFDFFGASDFSGILKKINRPDENGDGLADYFIEKYAGIRGDLYE